MIRYSPSRLTSGHDLKAWRRAAGWTQKDLADKSGLHVQTVKYWERQTIVAGHAPDCFAKAFAAARISRPASENRRETDAPSPTSDKTPVHAKMDRCGARTRKGEPCKAKALPEKRRCKFHGGMSTGPRTPEGRQRIAEAARLRWKGYRAAQVDGNPA